MRAELSDKDEIYFAKSIRAFSLTESHQVKLSSPRRKMAAGFRSIEARSRMHRRLIFGIETRDIDLTPSMV
ncbi:hypothetical protein [Beijerinckia sp. L45]|uniref:hypothetical protein n=1 Tax=Beijerinckia sp. L45 TaxID=1641855 RepID=UPI00131E0704|nr:hypothetical protein [Beijerinckia sp. L45]